MNLLFKFFLVSLLSIQAYAQQNGPGKKHGVSIAYGQNFLLGDFGDLGDDSTNVDFYYHYRASYTFQLLVNAHLNKFQKNSQEIKLMSLNTSIKAKMFDFDSFAPYLMGGLGFYSPNAKRIINSQSITTGSNTVFGLNFGGGVDLNLNNQFSAGFLAHYHYPFKASIDNQPDLKGSYLKLLVQLTYYFL